MNRGAITVEGYAGGFVDFRFGDFRFQNRNLGLGDGKSPKSRQIKPVQWFSNLKSQSSEIPYLICTVTTCEPVTT